MESHSSTPAEWSVMKDGPWRPRPTVVEAVAKCLAWTGLLGIPAMRVRDQETGTVVWAWGDGIYEDAAGPWVELPVEEWRLAKQAARARLTGKPPAPVEAPPATGDQLTLTF